MGPREGRRAEGQGQGVWESGVCPLRLQVPDSGEGTCELNLVCWPLKGFVLALPVPSLGWEQRVRVVTSGGGPRMDSNTGSSTSPCSRPRSVRAVSTMKKYLRGWVVSWGPCSQCPQALLPCPELSLPYDEVKVGTSKHEQTQQCGDGPVGNRGKCVL